MTEKIVGIFGGMGTEATVDFFAKVVALTHAKKDQDHLRIIIYNNPKIPDRTEAILNKDESILPALVETSRTLERAGADFIVIPCNTVHYLHENLQKEISIPILHMIKEVFHSVRASPPGCSRVGLLATTGTVNSNLYQKEFLKAGIEVITPTSQSQDEVMKAILKIKANQEKEQARKDLIREGNTLIECNAEALILGCTDISLVIKAGDFKVPVFDSTTILAEATVKFARSGNVTE